MSTYKIEAKEGELNFYYYPFGDRLTLRHDRDTGNLVITKAKRMGSSCSDEVPVNEWYEDIIRFSLNFDIVAGWIVKQKEGD